MRETQTVTLAESVKAQKHGIVLHWQGYENGAVEDYEHFYQFVPKRHGINSAGEGVSSGLMHSATGNAIGMKYVYVSSARIIGHELNDRDSTKLNSGLTITPKRFVLTEVLGV